MKKQLLYFGDLSEGKILKTKPGKPISRKMIETYQKLTGETARSHADPVFAKQFGFKGIVVPGYLLEALASSLVRRDTPLEIVAQSETRNKFISPVYPGARIRVESRVVSREDRPKKPYGKVVVERKIYNQANVLCSIFTLELRVAKKGVIE